MKYNSIISAITVVFLITACGGGDSDNPADDPIGNPQTLSLNTIGDKTATANENVNFTLVSSNPNGGTLSYSVSVGAGSADPFNVASGNDATFNMSGNGVFNWIPSDTEVGSYELLFTVQNTSGESDSETVMIVVEAAPGQFEIGESNYNDRCQRCHGPAGDNGSQVPIQCIQEVVFNEKVNGGTMTGYASGWSDTDKAAVLFYLNNVDPGNC